ncbi:MAG: NAD(P)-dependent alcohol dehydrogenase, partial [Actinomycetia bacterium]|nr:NAD(P)-dependent alcohol dehydrogenase [Actinomycetes bacterium]
MSTATNHADIIQSQPASNPSQQQMHAVTQDRYGSADVLEFRTVDRPATAANDVLIEVHAAGVDRGTWHLMTGTPYLIRLMGFGLTKPKNRIAGADVAGQVVAVGADV